MYSRKLDSFFKQCSRFSQILFNIVTNGRMLVSKTCRCFQNTIVAVMKKSDETHLANDFADITAS